MKLNDWENNETSKFVVGFTNPLDINVTFNWWIVELQNITP